MEGVTGMFVNTLCLRGRPRPDQDFTGFLGATAGQVLTALDHQDFPYERLVELVEPEHSPGRNPVFDTMLALQPAGLHDLELLGAPVRFAEEAIGQSMFDLNLHLFDQTDRLRGIWAYRSDLFDSATVAALRDTLIEILDAVLSRPRVRIGELTGPAPSGPASTPAPEIALKF
jgi:non-ribosomal peptide synthetase component F